MVEFQPEWVSTKAPQNQRSWYKEQIEHEAGHNRIREPAQEQPNPSPDKVEGTKHLWESNGCKHEYPAQ
jgi:hypothetical protein